MAVVRRSSASRRDYRDIWRFIAADNPEAADQMLDRFEAKLTLLARHPYLGCSRHKLRPHLRSFPVGNYVIFYFPTSEGIHLLRVLGGAQNHRRILRQRRRR